MLRVQSARPTWRGAHPGPRGTNPQRSAAPFSLTIPGALQVATGRTNRCLSHVLPYRQVSSSASQDVGLTATLPPAMQRRLRLIVSPPVPITQVGANALMVHLNAITVLGVVWAVGRGETQAVVSLQQRLAFGEQREPPRFEFSFRHACWYALYGHCVPVSRRIVPARCRFGHERTGAGQQAIGPFGSARLTRASTDAATRAGAAAG